jgi:hypothetical protein
MLLFFTIASTIFIQLGLCLFCYYKEKRKSAKREKDWSNSIYNSPTHVA